MDVPVFNRGAHLYTVKLNVTGSEAFWILKQKWYKLRGQPMSKEFGNLFDLVAAWRKPGEILYLDEGLVVDHVRWNRLDNRKAWLRPCTVAENNRNMSYRRPI